MIKDRLTKETLNELYTINECSLQDIANDFDCTKVYIAKLMKSYNIPRRSKSNARKLAVAQGKIIGHSRNYVNEKFFDKWSDEMAYVLGFLYADGCITHNTISASQKEPEILFKVLKAMDSNCKVRESNTREIFAFHLCDEYLSNSAREKGLIERKSLTMTYPNIPEEYERHFIRGLWDGDGSIMIGKNGYPSVSFVCGSLEFITMLKERLEYHGMRVGNVNPDHNAYKIRLSGFEQCDKMGNFFYLGVDELYLNRKHEKSLMISAIYKNQ